MSVALDPLAAIARSRLIVIIRSDTLEDEIGSALVESGVEVAEISLVSDGALGTITRWREMFPELVLGAGTVLDASSCERAMEAGAAFLVSPGLEPGVGEAARAAGVPYIPGALTPTEVRACAAQGAELIKLFPAGPLGAAYMKQLLGPFPELRLVPTGGVDVSNANEFLGAGAAAVAVGSSIVRPGSTYESVAEAARRVVSSLEDTKQGDERNAG
jgi:2-dehydro-3-deoxyphosphogluconate aldolase/(4S)-4-hydroxy-2-oxoglutarate aldolase